MTNDYHVESAGNAFILIDDAGEQEIGPQFQRFLESFDSLLAGIFPVWFFAVGKALERLAVVNGDRSGCSRGFVSSYPFASSTRSRQHRIHRRRSVPSLERRPHIRRVSRRTCPSRTMARRPRAAELHRPPIPRYQPDSPPRAFPRR
jgi:hypothetical protein